MTSSHTRARGLWDLHFPLGKHGKEETCILVIYPGLHVIVGVPRCVRRFTGGLPNRADILWMKLRMTGKEETGDLTTTSNNQITPCISFNV